MRSYPDYAALRKDLENGITTCKERVVFHLGQIRKQSHLNAFLSVYEDEALLVAEKVDRKIADGTAGKLAGLVVGIKDVLSHEGHPLQAASRILDGFTAQYNATVVERLLNEDAIIIGRQNCDEFAMGSSSEHSAFGPVRNPVNPNHVAGGSSGGSAVAVAGDMCQVSLGSDTGGSVRQPAAFCGIFGLKPTYSRISRFGLIAYASSFDCIGIFAKSTADCALILGVIAGPDGKDSTASERDVPDYVAETTVSKSKTWRVAVLSDIPEGALQPEIKQSLDTTVSLLKKNGHQVTPVPFPLNEHILPTYYILTTAEASSNLARYDGVRYGYRTKAVNDLEEMYRKTRTEGFGEEVRRRILLGNYVLSSDYYDAYYDKAQRVRRMIRDELRKILSDHDVILMPTAPTTAFPLGSHPDNPLAMYLADLFSVQANVAGLPALSFPFGADQSGLPIGLQLMADDFQETNLLACTESIMSVV